MFQNYFKIAWRNVLRHKGISSINIIGFSLGLSFTMLIGAYIWRELEVNQSLKNSDRQFIIQSKWKDSNMGPEITTLAPLGEALKRDYPQLVGNYYRWDGVTVSVSKGDKHFREEAQIGDTTFLEMFGFQLLEGTMETAFHDPSSVVITYDAAIKYFGSNNAIGQTLSIENFSGERKDFYVGAVLKTPEYNSVTGLANPDQAQVYLPSSAIPFFGRSPLNDWGNNIIPTYITLKDGASVKDVEKAMRELIQKHAHPYYAANLKPYIMPLKSYYLELNNGLVKKMLYTLFFISQFILLMALINFINISISGATRRIREMGVRKVLGGVKQQLIFQFLTESVLLVFLSVMIALVVYQLSRSFFSDLLGKALYRLYEFPPLFYVILLGLILVIGLLAGLFPAFVFSSFKTIDSLKGKIHTVSKNMVFRKVLVGFQFSIATFVLIGMFVIAKQVSLFFGTELGYNKDYVISVATPRNWNKEGVEQMKVARNEFKRLAFISDASLSYAIPNGKASGSREMIRRGTQTAVLMNSIETDANYAGTYGMAMLSGSFLKENNDSTGIVINETAAKALGWLNPEDAIGKQLIASVDQLPYTIKGVTKDFHFASMKEQIQPLCFINIDGDPRYRFMSFKLQPGNLSVNIKVLQKKWGELFPGAPFEYEFMDDSLAGLYKTELQLKKAAYVSSILSVIIVLLGIIGLVSVNIQKRAKEISIRKVLGSSAFAITKLFVSDFLVIGIIAGIIACPIAWYVFQNWLNNYSYRINLTVIPFIVSMALLLFITLILISIQTIKTAKSNPVKSLRAE